MGPELFATWSPRVLSILRIMTALLFLQYGTAELFGHPHVAMFDGLRLFSLFGIAGMIELVGGTLLLIGLFTRPVAFILSGEMAAAYFMEHAPHSFFSAAQPRRAGNAVQLRLPVSGIRERRRLKR